MKKYIIFLIIFTILLSLSCFRRSHTHKLVPVHTESLHQRKCSIADIYGDEKDELIFTTEVTKLEKPLYRVRIYNQQFDVLSEINFGDKVNNLSFCNIDDDPKLELFICAIHDSPDSSYIYLTSTNYAESPEGTSTRIMKKYEPIFRKDKFREKKGLNWNTSLYAKFSEDINNDNVDELIVKGWAAFSCYPRGIYIYDRNGQLLWEYYSGNGIYLLYEDLDGNGEKEFILSGKAHKNCPPDEWSEHDMNSYIFIVDNHGNLLTKELNAKGFSRAYSRIIDIEKDGTKELVTAKFSDDARTGGKDGIYIRRWKNNKFQLINKIEFNNKYDHFFPVCDIDGDGVEELFVSDEKQRLICYTPHLKPKIIFDKIPLTKPIKINDLDGDGKKEIIAATENNRLIVLDYKFNIKTITEKLGKGSKRIKILNRGEMLSKQIILKYPDKLVFMNYEKIPPSIMDWIWFIAIGILIVVSLIFWKYRQLYTTKEILTNKVARYEAMDPDWIEQAAVLAHDLKNKSDFTLSIAKRLKNTTKTPEATDIVEKMEELNKFSYTLSRILSFNVNLAPVNTSSYFKTRMKRYKLKYQNPDISIEYDVETNLPEILIDKDNFSKVIENLLYNAMQAIENKGTIAFSAYRKDDSVIVKIHDNGKGITNNHLTQIRDTLQNGYIARTTKEQGTGFGLMFANKVIKKHYGTFSIDSQEGEWTEITITLPIERK